jgi:hypothetical protein
VCTSREKEEAVRCSASPLKVSACVTEFRATVQPVAEARLTESRLQVCVCMRATDRFQTTGRTRVQLFPKILCVSLLFSFFFSPFNVYAAPVTTVGGDWFRYSDQYMMTRQIIKRNLILQVLNQYCNFEMWRKSRVG